MFSYIARVGIGLQFLCLVSIALCGSTTVTGASGLTTVTATVGSSGWTVANSSAETATITYNGTISVLTGSQNPTGTEFKCINNDGIFGPKTLNGLSALISDSSGSAGVSTSGNTQFSTLTAGVPQYYQTSWATTATTSGTGSSASSGTYDPWSYTSGALQQLGLQPGTEVDFYFQVELGAGSAVVSGAGEAGKFSFNAYASKWDATTIPFLSAAVTRGPSGFSFTATQSSDPNVFVYLLPSSVAVDDTITPAQKVSLGTLMGANGVHDSFGSDLTGIGALIDDLHFGVMVRNFVTPTNLGDNDVVFSTHLDTFSQAGPVPEPASLLVLGSAALLALRRRRR